VPVTKGTCEPRLEAEELECAQETQNNVEKRPASCAQSDKETLKSDGAQEERGEKRRKEESKCSPLEHVFLDSSTVLERHDVFVYWNCQMRTSTSHNKLNMNIHV